MVKLFLSRGVHLKALIIGLAIIIGSSLTPGAGRAERVGTKRTELQRHDLSASGREVVQVRVDLDPAAVSPKHTHPGEEVIYVLQGAIEYQVEGQPTRVYKAGNVLMIPARAVHTARNVGSVEAAELATYIVEKDKQLVELVK